MLLFSLVHIFMLLFVLLNSAVLPSCVQESVYVLSEFHTPVYTICYNLLYHQTSFDPVFCGFGFFSSVYFEIRFVVWLVFCVCVCVRVSG